MVIRIVVVALERGDGATDDANALLVGFLDNLLVGIDDALGCLYAITGIAKVVYSLEEDDPPHALLSQQVALITA